MIAVIGIGTALTYLNMNTARRELSTSYMASLDIFSERYADALESYQSIAMSLASDNNLIALNQSPQTADISIMWDYAELLRKLRFFSLNNELGNNITVYLPRKNRAFSSRDSIFNFEPDNGMDDCFYFGSDSIYPAVFTEHTRQHNRPH